MVKIWSRSWISSLQPRKQRKYRTKAPLHVRRKFLAAPLSKELKEQYNTRSIPVRQGDTVRITTGQFKGTNGKITKVSLKRGFVHVEGAVLKKADGTDSHYPLNPSNVVIIKLDVNDTKRVEKLERLKKENGKH